MKYTVVIDESGEFGLKNIRSEKSGGADPYVVMSGAIFRNSNRKYIEERIKSVENTINKEIHMSDLKHRQKVLCCRMVGDLGRDRKILSFSVISNKRTLGVYSNIIRGDVEKYYNKCAQYLLETLGMIAKEYRIDKNLINIFFEERRHNYNKLRNLIRACIKNPIREKVSFLRYINPDLITSKKKTEYEVLKIADILSNSVYHCVNRTRGNYFIPEYRYYLETNYSFYFNNEDGSILNYGIRPIHKMEDMDLDTVVKDIFIDSKRKL